MPTSSLAKITIRRAMNRASSPASSIRAEPVDGGVGVAAAHRLDERADHVVVVVASVAQRRSCRGRPRCARCVIGTRVGERAATSTDVSTWRPSPPAAVDEQVDGVRRRRSCRAPPGRAGRGSAGRRASSGSRRNSVLRLRSGGLTSKNGFSVVAPISVSVPSSTAGSRASCCALEKRWISSRNRIVPWSCSPRRWRARSMHLTHVLHAGGDGRHLLEGPRGGAGDGQRERRLAGARRPPEERRREPVLLDEAAQRTAGADELLLADDVVDGSRAQPGGERRLGPQTIGRRRREQVLSHPPTSFVRSRTRSAHPRAPCGTPAA